MRAANALLAMLRRYEVTDVFGLPGETSLDLYDAWREFPEIAYHMCRDERNSVFMADGYAKATGKVGICEGPSVGSTHMVPGAAEALTACVPMLIFTSDVPLDMAKKNMLTACDQTAIFRGVTKESFTLTRGYELPFVVRRAFRLATSGRPGPVHIRIPSDIYAMDVPESEIYEQKRFAFFPGIRTTAANEDIEAAVRMIRDARRPVILCGQGCIHSGAWSEIAKLAERREMLVGTTINAKGAYPETNDRALGVVGARGCRAWSNELVAESDLILFAGASTDSAATDGWRLPDSRSDKAMLQIDVAEGELGNNYRVLPLMGDVRETLRAILSRLGNDIKAAGEWIERCRDKKKAFEDRIAAFERSLGDRLHPYTIARSLQRLAPNDAFFVFDPGIAAVYPASFTQLAEAGRRCAFNFGMGALGYAIPAAIGAKVALGNGRAVVGVVGDGSFGFTVGELETAVRLGLDITYILIDNESFGWIRGTEFVLNGGKLPNGYGRFTDFVGIDYVKIAEGFGLRAFAADSAGTFEACLKICLETDGPKMISVHVEPEDRDLPPVPGWSGLAGELGMNCLY